MSRNATFTSAKPFSEHKL